MINRTRKYEEFETSLLKEKSDIMKNFQLVDGLYKEAVELGVFPLKDPLEGLDVKIRIAKVVNSV